MNASLLRPLSIALLCAVSAPCGAEESSRVLFAGLNGSSLGQYGYVGVVMPSEGAKLGNGTFQRFVASGLRYRYDLGTPSGPANVRAEAPGLEWAFGVAGTLGVWQGDISLAVGVRDTHLSIDDPSNRGRGTQAALTPQVQARWAIAPTLDFDILATHSFGPDSSYLRARLAARPTAGWKIGPEAARSVGPSYRSTEIGLRAETVVAAGITLGGSLGRVRNQDGREATFFGVEFSRLF